MLAMLFIVGYGSAKIILDRITLDDDIFVNQVTRSIEAIGLEDETKVLEYVKESVDSEESITNIQLAGANGKIVAMLISSSANISANSITSSTVISPNNIRD